MKQSANDDMHDPLVYPSIIRITCGLLTYTRHPLSDYNKGWHANTTFNFLKNGSFGMPIVNNLSTIDTAP